MKYWDWENPTGQAFIDAMGPEFNSTLNPPSSEWKSLDEYLKFVEAFGVEPLFGINSLNEQDYNPESEGTTRAVRMVRCVEERGLGGGICP